MNSFQMKIFSGIALFGYDGTDKVVNVYSCPNCIRLDLSARPSHPVRSI